VCGIGEITGPVIPLAESLNWHYYAFTFQPTNFVWTFHLHPSSPTPFLFPPSLRNCSNLSTLRRPAGLDTDSNLAGVGFRVIPTAPIAESDRMLTHVRVWNRALSAAEVFADYSGQPPLLGLLASFDNQLSSDRQYYLSNVNGIELNGTFLYANATSNVIMSECPPVGESTNHSILFSICRISFRPSNRQHWLAFHQTGAWFECKHFVPCSGGSTRPHARLLVSRKLVSKQQA